MFSAPSPVKLKFCQILAKSSKEVFPDEEVNLLKRLSDSDNSSKEFITKINKIIDKLKTKIAPNIFLKNSHTKPTPIMQI